MEVGGGSLAGQTFEEGREHLVTGREGETEREREREQNNSH